MYEKSGNWLWNTEICEMCWSKIVILEQIIFFDIVDSWFVWFVLNVYDKNKNDRRRETKKNVFI